MKILVTGALGVIGSKLVQRLKEKGHNVFGVDLYHTNKTYSHGLGKIEFEDYFRADISEYRQIEYVIKYFKPDFVYNCAAEFGRWNGEFFYEKVWKSNVIGFKNILKLQNIYGFKLIHCSSSEVYGDYSDIMYEDILEKNPIAQMNDYAISKRVNELQIKNEIVLNNNQVVYVRFFNTYGPGEWYHPFRSVNCLFSYNLLNGKKIKVFKGHTRTSTYIDDAINTFSNIIDNFKSGEIYNISSSTRHSIEDLARLCIKYTGASPDLVEFIDANEILTTKDKIVSNEKSVKDLQHIDITNLEDGVKNTIEWMKNYYKL